MARLRPAPVLLGPTLNFPDPGHALSEPNGLLAIGGDLSTARLLAAYRAGIFPWYGEGDPILWWSPDPRAVIKPARLYIARRFRRFLQHCPWTLTLNQSFLEVIQACATSPRPGQAGTWLTQDMQKAYYRLHLEGHAHSLEVWNDGELVGGIYGLGLGRMFFGESMFSRQSNASKLALMAMCRHMQAHDLGLLDCQVANAHTLSLGAQEISREYYLTELHDRIDQHAPEGIWQAQSLPAPASLAASKTRRE